MKENAGWVLWALLAAAAWAFTAGMQDLSLHSLDDAFYARKAIEMARVGGSWTVTFAGAPAWQNPPLQFWITAVSFRVFGENDFAARLPVVLMALGLVAMTWRIARVTAGRTAAEIAAMLMLVTPIVVSAGRGTMLEIPFAFWTTLGLMTIVWSIDHPKRAWLIAFPLGAAILTKSVLGLNVVLVLLAMGMFPRLRPTIVNWRLWAGVVTGLAIGASWPLSQWLAWGPEAVRAHFVGEVIGRAVRQEGAISRVIGVGQILLQSFQPVLLIALLGSRKLARLARVDAKAGVIALWVIVPIVTGLFSSARSARYLWPILPALAVLGGTWLSQRFPHSARVVSRFVVPGLLLTAGCILRLSPGTLTRDQNQIFKSAEARQTLGHQGVLPYFGDQYWSVANPLLYYTETQLAVASPSVEQAIVEARQHPGRLLMVDRSRLGAVASAEPRARVVLEGPEWALFEMPVAGAR